MEAGVNKNGYTNTKSIQQLKKRLNDDRTVQAIDRLLDRIDVMEKAVGQLTTLIEQGPGLVAMTVDMADEAYRKADAQGINTEERLRAALHLAEKLTAPAMVEKLDALVAVADQAPGLVAMTVDMADEAYRKADAQGINIESRLGAALHIAEKLTAPAMVEKLDALMELANQAPGLVAMMVDSFDEEMKSMSAKNIDVNALTNLAQNTAAAIGEANQMPETKVGGVFSMIRIMKDPDRQKTIGYFMNIAKAFGKRL